MIEVENIKEKPNYIRVRVVEIIVIPASSLDKYLKEREAFREKITKYGAKSE